MAHSIKRCHLTFGLMFHLVVLPLTKQLTCLCGNLWSSSLRSSRAERIEFLLLHRFHHLKYIVPEKYSSTERKEMERDNELGTVKGPSYAGGLVLEPKRGFYDQFILLLDFNSLYPSIIQEYDICFTTQKYWDLELDKSPEDMEISSDMKGVLPAVLKHLIDRRLSVKALLKRESDSLKLQQLDIRQKALKLVANAMYGCLGFSFSRFYCRPLAALVTALGRATLSNTVELAETLGFDVIYGDTDSIMVNTKSTDLEEAYRIGKTIKKEVNKIYNRLEIDVDGVYKSMLLLRKKKYAALAVVEKQGVRTCVKEMKGLDLVRRDWCVLSKEIGTRVVDEILSGREHGDIVDNIQNGLQTVAEKVRSGALPVEQFVITKALTKSPQMYEDPKAHPHVAVAFEMIQQGRNVSIGDHIPFVIVEGSGSMSERAHHPSVLQNNSCDLKIDFLWYLENQILNPVCRLCEPIAGLESAQLANCLGLDSTKYSARVVYAASEEEFSLDLYEYDDEAAFKDIEKLHVKCSHCNQTFEFKGFFDDLGQVLMQCPTMGCKGFLDSKQDICRLTNAMKLYINKNLKRFFMRIYRCDEPQCELSRGTRHSLHDGIDCPKPSCSGKLVAEFPMSKLYKTLRYLQLLVNVERAMKKSQKKNIPLIFPHKSKELLSLAQSSIDAILSRTAYHWVEPSSLFASIMIAPQ